MTRKFLVIGASGYLGQQVTRMLTDQVIPTHRRTPKFLNSLRYDFYADTALPIQLDNQIVVIFTAAVEMNQPRERLAHGMRCFLDLIGN